MSELKAGDSLDFQVGDKTLTVAPVPFGQTKKILRLVFKISQEITGRKTNAEDVLTALPDIAEKYVTEIIPLLFRKGTHSFLTADWMDENLTIPQMRAIVEAAIKVNGLDDFFGKGGPLPKTNGKVTPGIPPENSGSITSSDSATAGGLKT